MTDAFEIRPAARVNTPAFIALAGPSGSGKTRSALELATGLAGDGKILLADTEGNRALHYADLYAFDHAEFRPPYTPERCAELIDIAEKLGYAVLVVDSGSDEFEGEGGLQEIKEATKDEFWARTKARHKHALINRIRRARCHVIFCLRCEERVRISKVYNDRTGREQTVVETLGWQPICEKRFLYEMQSSFRFDPEHPGCPVPIKLYDIHAQFFPPNQKLTRDAGRALAAWAAGAAPSTEQHRPEASPGATPPDPSTAGGQGRVAPSDGVSGQQTTAGSKLIEAAQVKARAGKATLDRWLNLLTDKQAAFLKPHLAALHEIAAAEDRAVFGRSESDPGIGDAGGTRLTPLDAS